MRFKTSQAAADAFWNGNKSDMASDLGVIRSSLNNWQEPLTDKINDRIIGCAMRTGRMRFVFIHDKSLAA